MPAILENEHVVTVKTDHFEPTPLVPAVPPQVLPNVATVANEILQKEEQPQSKTCWQKIGGAYEVVKTKLTTWWSKVEDWTNRNLPPTAAKCVLAFIKFLPFAIAFLFVPSTIIFGAFALAVVIRFACPEVFSNNPKWHGVFSVAAKIMGVYCGILGVYNGISTSFSPTPHISLLMMTVNLAITGVCFYAAHNEWTPKPVEPSHHTPHASNKVGHRASRPNTPSLHIPSRAPTPSLPLAEESSVPTEPVAPSSKPPLHPTLIAPIALAPRGPKPIGGTFTQPLTATGSALASRRTLPVPLTIAVTNKSTPGGMPDLTPPIQASSAPLDE